MTKPRKSLDEIMGKFDETESTSALVKESESVTSEPTLSSNSITAKLTKPQKKVTKVRFTLDLEKPLDDRLNKAAKSLNCPKSEIAREALDRLLDELEQERQQ
jgi:predicted HAD superfamily phosphohydrolase YqeG